MRNFSSTVRNTEMFISRIIITSDESRIHHYDVLTKGRSMISRRQPSPRKEKFKVQTTKSWLATSGTVKGTLLVEFLDRGATFNSERQVQTLKKLEKQTRKVRPHMNMNQVCCMTAPDSTPVCPQGKQQQQWGGLF